MAQIKRNKYFNDKVPGLDEELTYMFNQTMSQTGSSDAGVGVGVVNASIDESFEFDLNTQDGKIIYTPQADEWITEIIVVCKTAFNDSDVSLKIQRFDTKEYLVENVALTIDGVVSPKSIWTKFDSSTDLLLEFDKASATEGEGIIFIKTYKP